METFEVQGCQVLKVVQVNTGNQTATIKSHHTHLYHLQLSYSAANKEVKAEVFDWQDNRILVPDPAVITDCTFEYEGQQITVPLVNGAAVITFDVTAPGEHLVKTVTPRVQNGEVLINVA